MAKPIGSRDVPALMRVQADQPGLAVKEITLWSPPSGVDYLNLSNRIEPQFASEIINLRLDRGKLVTREGTKQLGVSIPGETLMALINFVTPTGVGFILLFTTRTLKLLQSNSTWLTIPLSSVFTGGVDDQFTFVAWNNTLLVSNGVDGLWEFTPATQTLVKITGAPSAKFLTAFGGRVIASGIPGDPAAVQWSVKNDSHDWAGIGSGIEELLSTPGGLVDEQMGVHPINDTTALMARSNSIWQMTETGNPDAPFRFSRLYANLGTRAPRSIDVFPGGLFIAASDNIYMINERDITPIGQLVKDRMGVPTDKFVGRYLVATNEYWLSVDGTDIYRYSLQDKGWTVSRYPFQIRNTAVTLFSTSGISIDQLTGTIDSLVGTIDSLAGAKVDVFLAFVTKDTRGIVVQEASGTTSDVVRQTGFNPVGWSIRTGTMLGDSPLDKTQLLEAQLEYQFTGVPTQPIVFNVSGDGGLTWDVYSTQITTITKEQTIMSARQTVERRNIQVEVASDSLDKIELASLTLRLVKGARIRA